MCKGQPFTQDSMLVDQAAFAAAGALLDALVGT